ncbi:MAG: universal stress protein [Polyangiaceae bacterium]
MNPNDSRPDRFVVLVAAEAAHSGDYVTEVAARMARPIDNAELHIVHVLVPPMELTGRTETPTPYNPTAMLEQGREYLEHTGRLAKTDFTGPIVGHLAVGEPWREILQFAEKLQADLILVGTHNLTGLKRIALGSASEKVVRLAKCPVLVVRPKEYETRNVPEIEPACPDCVRTQRETGGRTLWCERHGTHHPTARTYSEIPQSFALGSGFLRP